MAWERLSHFIDELALQLINQSTEEIPGIISSSCDKTAEFTGAANFAFYLISDDNRFTTVYSSKNYEIKIINPELIKTFTKNQVLNFASWQEIPRDLGIRNYFAGHELSRLLVIPIYQIDKPYGFFWIELTSKIIPDYEDFSGFLIKLGRVFGKALERYQREEAKSILKDKIFKKNEELELILDNLNAHIFYLKDPETNGYVNKAVEDFLGKSKEVIINSKIKDIFESNQAEILIKQNKRVFKKKKPLSYEIVVKNKQDEERTLLTTVTPKLDEENNVKYAICAAIDVTENKMIKEKLLKNYIKTNKLARKLERTNQRLKDNQRLLKINFDQSNIGMVISDPDLNIIRVNRTFSKMFGYSKTELKKMNVKDFTHPDDLEKSFYYVDRLLNGELRKTSFEKRYINKKGQAIWGRLHIALARDEDGLPLYFLSQLEDITAEKRIKNVFKQQEEELEYNRLKTHFFANLSHELRTPLNLIFSTLKLLTIYKDKHLGLNTDRKFNRYLSLLRQNGYRLLRMVNNLIDLTRIDSDYYNLNLGNHDIIKLVEQIVNSTGNYITNKDRKFVFNSLPGKKIITCDPFSIERILLNLISNALKFTHEGNKIMISLQDQGESVLISVKDNGIGIKKKNLDIIFEQFRQVEDMTFTRNNEGSGIGLAIVKKLVELHNGQVWVESEYGRGSEFFVELPARVIPELSATSLNDSPGNVPQELIDRIIMEFSDIYE